MKPYFVLAGLKKNILVLLCSGILLLFSFPGPFEILPLSWIAFIPTLVVLRSTTPKKSLLLGFVFGVFYYGLGGFWMFLAGSLERMGWSLLTVTWATVHFVPLFFTVTLFTKKYPKLFLFHFISLWILFDWLVRERLFNLPFVNLADTHYRVLPLIQIADVGGIHLVALLVLLINCGTYIIFNSLKEKMLPPHIDRGVLLITAVALVAAWIYGTNRIDTLSKTASPEKAFSILGVQPNFKKESASENRNKERLNTLIRLTENSRLERMPDLIVWPETSLPDTLFEEGEQKTLRVVDVPTAEKIIEFYERNGKIPLIFGSYILPHSSGRAFASYYNSAVFLSGNSFEWYHKREPILLAEYAPVPVHITRFLKFVYSKLNFDPGQKSKGEETRLFQINGISFGTLICSESGLPELARAYAQKKAAFLLNPSDNSGMQSTWEMKQQSAANRFRSIENRAWLVSVGSIGPTEAVSPLGEVKQTLPYQKEGTVLFTLPLTSPQPQTWYTKVGDAVITFLVFLIGLETAYLLFTKTRRKSI